MIQFDHITGRRPGLSHRGLRRMPSPIWFLRPDAHPIPIDAPRDIDLEVDLREDSRPPREE